MVVGKANLHEFAWGVTSQNPWYGTVQNPVQPGRTTGGSSGGNAAALAAGLCDLGLGTDTGCSIRLPASCCGVVGLKPSWGRIPSEGVFPLCPTFDTVGPMARPSPRSLRCGRLIAQAPVPERAARGLTDRAPDPAAVGRRAGPAREPRGRAHVDQLEALGALVVEAEIPEPPEDTWPLFMWEAAHVPPRHVSGARRRVRRERPREARAGAGVTRPRRTAPAASVRRWRAFRPAVDLYVAPVVGEELPPVDCDELEVRLPLSAFLRPFNVLGWAALAIGDLQLIAPDDESCSAPGSPGNGPLRATSVMSPAAGRLTSTFEPKSEYVVSMVISVPAACGS